MKAEYEHECSRAELLGLPKPIWDEFIKSKNQIAAEIEEKKDEVQIEEIEAESKRNENAIGEEFRKIGGGLDELNSILLSTQKKINRFKTACGSFSNLLKIHITTSKKENENDSSKKEAGGDDEEIKVSQKVVSDDQKVISVPPRQHSKTDSAEVDKLDSLLNKAERAELSLSSQNKQMRKFLN